MAGFVFTLILWGGFAHVTCAQVTEGPVYITEIMTTGNEILSDEDGEFPDWIEIYNAGSEPVDLQGWHCTDDASDLNKWTFPTRNLASGEYLILFASGKDRRDSGSPLHTNFSLDADGEFLALVQPDGVTVSHSYVPTYADQNVPQFGVSYGIENPGDPTSERYFLNPTPGAPNGDGVLGFLNPPSFSVERGFYEEPISLVLRSDFPGASIRYTTDGSVPTETNGTPYEGPIAIDSTSLIRAAVFHAGSVSSTVVTNTYLFLDDVIHQTRPDNFPDRWGNNVSADYDMDPDIVDHPDYSETIKDDLKSIPTLSIVMERDDLFGRSQGIYVNPEQKGLEWERPGSTEWIYADGRESFQINNGVRIQGGYSRIPDRRKHSFRLLFKREYGPPKLKHAVFSHSPVDEFDTIVLRGNYNYTWHGGDGGFGSTIGHAEYIRDEFARRTQLDMGEPASHGTYVHLYLNGLYWGVYNLCERPDDSFSASYLGGNKDDYDVITGGSRGISTTQVKAGNKTAWNEMMALVQAGNFQRDENYQAIQQYVDLDNLIDYMLLIYYTGNRDAPTVIGGGGTPWNFYTSRLRQPGAGLHVFAWDSEWCLEEPDRNVVNFHRGRDNPALIFQQLRANPDFLIRVADQVQKQFYGDGALTAESSIARYTMLAETIHDAIVGESARWGDARGGNPKTRNEDWLNEVYRLLTAYFPVRTDNVIQQLRDANLFPAMDAPVFNHPGGTVPAGFGLTMRSKKVVVTDTPLVSINGAWNYNEDGVSLGTSWKNVDYGDSGWEQGSGLLYVENSNLPARKSTELTLGRTTYYFRSRFTVDPGLNLEQTTVDLRTVIDDGAIVYINGEEVLRIGMPDGIVRYQDFASRTVGNAAYEGPFGLPGDVLRPGENVIAVEVHQINATSSDIVFGLELSAHTTNENDPILLPVYYTTDGSDPRLAGGQTNPSAVLFDEAVAIEDRTHIRARSKDGDAWSALSEITFSVDEPIADIAVLREYLNVSEVMYDPDGGNEYEFLELHNANPVSSLQLGGLAFTQGIQYEFPAATVLPPLGYLLLTPSATAEELATFRAYYGLDDSIAIAGPYTGKLANEGEKISLTTLDGGEKVLSFEYRDRRGWPVAADGAGHSLVPLETPLAQYDSAILDYGGNWRASMAIGGSPGREDPAPVESVAINEFAASTVFNDPAFPDFDSNDWIELYNVSSAPVALNGWYLSDDADDLKKWAIPDVQVPAFATIVFDEVSGFHPSPDTGFGLNRDGEQIYLSYLPGIAGQDRVVDSVRFKAQETGISEGRGNDGGMYWYRMEPTREAANQPLPIPLVVDEIMYAPAEPENSSVESDFFEYIEIYNASDTLVDLGDPNHPYRIDGGVSYVFQPGTVLPAKGRLLVVPFAADDTLAMEAFMERYEIGGNAVAVTGPYDGKLSNRGERIALEKALDTDIDGLPTSWAVYDEAIYFSLFPWTPTPVGSGFALQRLSQDVSGNDPFNWSGEEPTPGAGFGGGTGVGDWSVY